MTDGFRGFKRSEISFPDRKKRGAKPSTAGAFATFWRVRLCRNDLRDLGRTIHPSLASIFPHTLQKDNA
jgi:hypothetical protein